MKAKLMSSFAAGLIVATAISGAVYFLDKSEVTNAESTEKPTEAEMKELLASSGYVIHTEDEWKKQIATAESASNKNDTNEKETDTKEKTDEEVKETVIYRTMLTVSSGMTSIDVGEALVKANIIDNAMDFFKDVEKKGLSSNLRPGTYEVDSEMTVDEIMSTIFK